MDGIDTAYARDAPSWMTLRADPAVYLVDEQLGRRVARRLFARQQEDVVGWLELGQQDRPQFARRDRLCRGQGDETRQQRLRPSFLPAR